MKKLLKYGTALGVLVMAINPILASAQLYENEQLEINAFLKNQYLFEDNRDLGLGSDDSSSSFSVEGRINALYTPYNNLSFYLDARAVKTDGDTFVDQTTGESLSSDQFAELRQAWVMYGLDEYIDNLAIQVGRQRIREPYGLFWNRDQDAARIIYDTTEFSGFVGVAENLYSYRTSDNDFDEDQQDRFRAMAEGSWLLPYDQRFEIRSLYENDHSGSPGVGSTIEFDERDDEDNNLFWGGMRLWSNYKPMNLNNHLLISYRADLIGVGGTADNIDTSPAGGTLRNVDAINEVDVLGWAFDGEVDFALPRVKYDPVISFGYAYGSGDDDNGADGTDNSFRQSDLESNTSYIAGSSRPSHNYGEVLRPELSNLHVLSAGTTLNFTDFTDFSIIYHKYLLDDSDTRLRSSRVRQAVNGNDNDVGQGVDVLLNSDLESQFNIDLPVFSGVNFRSSLGAFEAGEAYGPNGDGEVVVRGLAEIQLRF